MTFHENLKPEDDMLFSTMVIFWEDKTERKLPMNMQVWPIFAKINKHIIII